MELKKRLLQITKTLVAIGSIIFIVHKLYNETQENQLSLVFDQLQVIHIWILLLVIILSFFNWATEALKWRFLIKRIQNLSFLQSFKAVLAGITIAIFTPNRVGEFGGRILALEDENKVAGIFATLLGGYAQLLITLILGLISLPIYLNKFPNQLELDIDPTIIFSLCFIVISLCLAIYLKIKFFAQYFERLIKNEKKKHFIAFMKDYRPNELFKILNFSFLRYVIFSLQFFLLLQFFGIDIAYFESIVCISLIYFIMTLIPVVSLFEFGVRGSVAVLVLGVYSPFSAGIIAASVVLWIINLAIPSLIGAVQLYKFKV